MDFDEIGGNLKSLFKNKKFRVACVIVGMAGLVLWIIRQNRGKTTTETSEDDYYDGSMAIGYAGYGYPYVNDGSENYYDDTWISERFDQIGDQFDQIGDRLDGIMDALDKDPVEDTDSGNSYEDFFGKGYSHGGGSASKVDEQAIIDAMEFNSSAWWDVTDKAGRDYLHAENEYLAQQIGAQYDSQTGLWYKDGLPLYNVNKGNAFETVTTTGYRPPSRGSADYVANVDYQAAINEAISRGMSADVINALNERRNEKIASSGKPSGNVNASFDPNTDYQALINQAKAAGVEQSIIDNLTAQRNAKINARKGGFNKPPVYNLPVQPKPRAELK